MAEQAVNTIYLLGEQPDALCSQMIKNMTTKVFTPVAADATEVKPKPEAEESEAEIQDTLQVPPTPARTIDNSAPTPFKMSRSESQESLKDDHAGSFPLAQLVFVVGHVAIKHIVYLELVEREFKRRKDEKAKGTPLPDTHLSIVANQTEKAANKVVEKDGNDLDAVAGNAEDDIGDLIATIREKELLYGDKSLLAVYGPMIAHICASPKRYRVSSSPQEALRS